MGRLRRNLKRRRGSTGVRRIAPDSGRKEQRRSTSSVIMGHTLGYNNKRKRFHTGAFLRQLLYLLPFGGILILLSVSKISIRVRFPILLVFVLVAGYYLFCKLEEWFVDWNFAFAFILSCAGLLAVLFGTLTLKSSVSDVTDLTGLWVLPTVIGSVMVVGSTAYFVLFRVRITLKNVGNSLMWTFIAGLLLHQVLFSVNALYDNSAPEIVQATLVGRRSHHIARGGGTTYYVKVCLDEEVDGKKGHEYRCSYDIYKNEADKEKVEIWYYDGLFRMPWCRVKRIEN